MSMHSIDAAAALEHLAAQDAVMARIIEGVGPFGLQPDATDPFRALARSIVFQQLSGKAASTIFSRFVGLFDPDGGAEREVRRSDPAWTPAGGPFPEPVAILAASDEALRGVGLSRQKVAALRSLAEHFAAGELGAALFADLDDEEIIRRTTQVRGIGRWSAEMFLMFHLGRPDVLPVNDVGINRAIQRQYGLEAGPKPADVLRIGEPWRPWATVACWYLWRSEDVVI
ncbi:MAG: DNA-3-methyladenine glycosylase [Dehalococcoidia bacterium]